MNADLKKPLMNFSVTISVHPCPSVVQFKSMLKRRVAKLKTPSLTSLPDHLVFPLFDRIELKIEPRMDADERGFKKALMNFSVTIRVHPWFNSKGC